jgi:hypothetical protein
MLAFLAAVVLILGGVGWYLDWYKVGSRPIEDPGHRNVSIDIDTRKIGADVQKGEQKIQQWLETHNADKGQLTATAKSDKAAVKDAISPSPK